MPELGVVLPELAKVVIYFEWFGYSGAETYEVHGEYVDANELFYENYSYWIAIEKRLIYDETGLDTSFFNLPFPIIKKIKFHYTDGVVL